MNWLDMSFQILLGLEAFLTNITNDCFSRFMSSFDVWFQMRLLFKVFFTYFTIEWFSFFMNYLNMFLQFTFRAVGALGAGGRLPPLFFVDFIHFILKILIFKVDFKVSPPCFSELKLPPPCFLDFPTALTLQGKLSFAFFTVEWFDFFMTSHYVCI